MTDIKVSIIIPLYKLNDRFIRDFKHFLGLDYPGYEIIVVHDNAIEFNREGVVCINTGEYKTSPAEKRDLAINKVKGSVYAFIDDDAYPDKNWIKNALNYFENDEIAAVGGPGLTPPDDTFMMKAGGLCYESLLGSWTNQYRFLKGRLRKVDDYPAYNLFVKKDIFEKIGGFGSTFYGGEDTKLCLEIVKTGKKILYAPDVIVYHHRRPLFMPHLFQVANVGLHRGYFVRKYPKTSVKIIYFLPSLFLLLLIFSIFSKVAALLLVIGILLFWPASFISCFLRSKNILMSLVSSIGIILMHLVYGFNFIRGLMKRELKV